MVGVSISLGFPTRQPCGDCGAQWARHGVVILERRDASARKEDYLAKGGECVAAARMRKPLRAGGAREVVRLTRPHSRFFDKAMHRVGEMEMLRNMISSVFDTIHAKPQSNIITNRGKNRTGFYNL